MTKIKNRSNTLQQIPHTQLIMPAVLVLLTSFIVLQSIREAAGKISDPMRYRGGIRNSTTDRKLNSKQLDIVLKSLREKTGYLEMGFDEDGFLNVGDRMKFEGGSATARSLIATAIECDRAIDLESHDYSSIVAFARLARPVVYQNRSSGAAIDVYPMELDFNDFKKLRGDNKVLAAFDLGFIIMHELGHAVLNLSDKLETLKDVGECEDYINRIRRELNLPIRLNYVAQTFKSPLILTSTSGQTAELVFAQSPENRANSKEQKFYLRWEANAVGPVRQDVASTMLKTGGGKPVAAALR
jgi:hypothetical protein